MASHKARFWVLRSLISTLLRSAISCPKCSLTKLLCWCFATPYVISCWSHQRSKGPSQQGICGRLLPGFIKRSCSLTQTSQSCCYWGHRRCFKECLISRFLRHPARKVYNTIKIRKEPGNCLGCKFDVQLAHHWGSLQQPPEFFP